MADPIRILCVFSTLDRGGAETMCMDLYRHMDRSLVEFDFVKHTPGIGAYEEEIVSLGGHIYTAPRFLEYNRLSYVRWWKKHLEQHPEHRIIHGHFFTISDVYFAVAKQLSRITVGHSHCTSAPRSAVENPIKNNLISRHISRIEKYADVRLSCSKPAGEWVYPHGDFEVLNNGIRTEQFAFHEPYRRQIRDEFGLGEALVIGTVGRIMQQKNPLGVVDIFNEICKRREDARLLWVGADTMPMAQQAKKRAEDYGIFDKIVFTGVRTDVNKLYQAMDVFILPSFYEGLPVVAVEAQASGLACFLSDAIAQETKITDRCTFLPIDKPEAWAEHILNAELTRVDTTQQIIDAGYDIHTTAAWLQDFYLKLSGERQ